MTLPEHSVNRPIMVLMATVSVLVLGTISVGRLPLTYLPEFGSTHLSVNVDYPSSSPDEVERNITRPLEEVLSTLNNLDEISSTSSANRSSIRVQFLNETNMDLAALEVRDRIDQVRSRLPADVERVTIRRRQMSDSPVIHSSAAWDGPREQLFQIAEETIRPRLERIDGVASVEIEGIESKQILVELDQGLMEAYGVDISDLGRALRENNVNVSGGFVMEGGKKYSLRTVGEFSDVDQIRKLPIQSGRLTLADVAQVTYGFAERTSFSRLDANDAVRVEVYKASTGNVVTVCSSLREELKSIEQLPQLQGRIKLIVYRDQSEGISKSLNDLKVAGLYGGGLAMVILFLFLMKFRSTLIISLAIPISVMFTLAVLYLARVFFKVDITINIVSLMGLMVAVGMLVDNSVVVLENIFRYKQEKGLPAREAAVKGSREVGVAVVASTTTTVAVFASFIFLPSSLLGRFFRDFGITVAVALVASLIVALTLIPMVASRVFTGPERPKQRLIVGLTRLYGRFMGYLLRWRFVTLLLVCVIGLSAYELFTHIGRDRMPRISQREVEISVLVERSFSKEQIEELYRNLEALFIERKEQLDLDTVSSRYNIRSSSRGRYRGEIGLYLRGEEGRLTTEQVQAQVRMLLPEMAGVEFSFGRRRHYGGGSDLGVEIELRGDDPAVLALYADEVKSRLLHLPELEDVQTTQETGDDEVHIRVDRRKAERAGVSSTMVARTILSALSTRATSRYKSEAGEIDIVLQLRGAGEISLDELRNTRLSNQSGEMVPLSAMIDFSYRKGPLAIQRDNRKAMLSVVANTRQGNTFWVNREIEAALADLGLPAGYSWSLGRDYWRMREEQEDSSFAIILAIILMYLIMASLFESFIHPLTILLTVPFSVIGVAILFYLTNTTLNNMAYLGILMLFGIVVNNGIILIDHINTLRRNGMGRNAAIVQGGMDRVRPILMTAATSLIGLLPLTLPAIFPEIFGSIEGRSRQWSPVSLAVLGGLTTSTLLTLIILPGVYSYMDDLQRGALWLFERLANPSQLLPRRAETRR